MAYDSHNLAHSLKGQVIIKQASLTAHTSQIFKTLAPSQITKRDANIQYMKSLWAEKSAFPKKTNSRGYVMSR